MPEEETALIFEGGCNGFTALESEIDRDFESTFYGFSCHIRGRRGFWAGD
jgi:hypothetical protein